MPVHASSLLKSSLALLIVIVTSLLLAGVVLMPRAAAQQPAASPVPPSEPSAVVLQNPIPADQLAFVSGYAGQNSRDLEKDKRFRSLMKMVIPRTEYHYGRDMPLNEAIDNVLGGSRQPVEIRERRYVLVTGHEGPYLRGRGFFWFDLQEGIALGGFYFEPTNGEPTPTLTVFSKQLKDDALEMSQFPPAFVQDLYEWVTVAGVPTVSPRYFIPENGKKYVLVHDEDYCWRPDNAPAPPQDACQRLNADAADADLNAAYFMKETRNAANATAWMVSPEQVAWIGFRDRSCAIGQDRWGCRIRMTRERTWAVIGRPPPRPRPPSPRGTSPSR